MRTASFNDKQTVCTVHKEARKDYNSKVSRLEKYKNSGITDTWGS